MQLHPTVMLGAWDDGRILDAHVSRSEFLGYSEYGHPQFETTRTELGELLYQLKYRGDRSVVHLIARAAYDFIREWNPLVDVIVPVPPSRPRSVQPLEQRARRILLLDDLYQSGATLNAIARLLKESGGAARVVALALTRARS